MIDVNGTYVQVSVNGSQWFSYTYAVRTLPDGTTGGLNKGFIGFGSNNSRGVLDNLNVSSVLTNTLDTTKYFEDGLPEQFTGPSSGSWIQSNGRDVGTAAANAYGLTSVNLGINSDPADTVEANATLNTTGIGGVAFDVYASNDFKFAVLDVIGQRVIVGHVDPKRGVVYDATFATALVAGTDYVLDVVLKDTVATVTLNGNVLGSYAFNAGTADGKLGLVTFGATTSVDRFELKTNDSAFVGAPPQPAELRIGANASVTEGNSGLTPVTVTLSLSAPAAAATSVNWTTVAGSATAGSDFQSASGTATFAAGSTTTSFTVYVVGDTVVEPNETFTVKLTSTGGFNVADGYEVVTIINDDLPPLTVSVGNATVTEGNSGTSTVNIPLTLSRASTSTVTVTVTTVAGTAFAGSDFVSKTATVTFAAGATSAVFSVAIVGDTVAEPTQTFTVQLSAPTGGATIATGTGTVTIIDNDGAMFAARTASAPTSTTLSSAVLNSTLAQAEAAWKAVLPSASFAGVTVTTADLAGDLLGFTLGKAITVDVSAAGWGWLQMNPGAGVAQMDLLAVLEHELGLTLGFAEADPLQPVVMARTLEPSIGPQAAPPLRLIRSVLPGRISAHPLKHPRKHVFTIRY